MLNYKPDKDIEFVSRTYLEGFSTQDLLTVAAQFGAELPEGEASRSSVISEILDSITESLLKESAGNDFSFKPDNFTGELSEEERTAATRAARGDFLARKTPPEHYNVTYIKALVRDPFWVFVFWELKEPLCEKLKSSRDFAGLRLKLNAVNNDCRIAESYSVDVGKNDTAWYFDFPETGEKFFAELFSLARDGRETPLCRTAVFEKPAILCAQETFFESDKSENPLVLLSGIKELPILYKKDWNTGIIRNKNE